MFDKKCEQDSKQLSNSRIFKCPMGVQEGQIPLAVVVKDGREREFSAQENPIAGCVSIRLESIVCTRVIGPTSSPSQEQFGGTCTHRSITCMKGKKNDSNEWEGWRFPWCNIISDNV